MANVEDEMLKTVNRNSEIVKVAEYILDKFASDSLIKELGFYDIKKIAVKIIELGNLSIPKILAGEADVQIEHFLESEKILWNVQRNSLVSEIKPQIKIPLKTVKKNVSKKVIALIMASLMLALGANRIVHFIEEEKENREIEASIGLLLNDEGLADKNIVEANSYLITNPGEAPIVAYYNDKIAMSIVNICIKDPDLLAISLHNVYFNMNYNRLDNMEDVFKYLQQYTKDDPSLESINNSISDCQSFLDYIMKQGLVEKDSRDFQEFSDAINEYKNIAQKERFAFSKLSEKTQKMITELISKYEKMQPELYQQYEEKHHSVDNLENNQTNEFGGRLNGS